MLNYFTCEMKVVLMKCGSCEAPEKDLADPAPDEEGEGGDVLNLHHLLVLCGLHTQLQCPPAVS